MKIYSKTLVLFVLATSVFTGFDSVLAANNEIAPEFNPICWQQDECLAARKALGASLEETGEGLVSDSPCDKKGWGKCLPVGQTTTKIAIGGKRNFKDIGVFILTVYNYLVGIAGLLALIVIIVAGMQWVVSGGNSETIGAAKKRIIGAVIGLVIAYLSYAILSTINNGLVQLRLPQVWLIRSSRLMPEFCSNISTTSIFADVGPSQNVVSNADLSAITVFPIHWPSSGNAQEYDVKFPCGEKFLPYGAGTYVCQGYDCSATTRGERAQMCIPLSKTSGQYECQDANISGRITYTPPLDRLSNLAGIISDGWDADEPVISGNTELYVLCNSQDYDDVSVKAESLNNGKNYAVSVSNSDLNSAVSYCATKGGARGFFLELELDEYRDPFNETHYVGMENGEVLDFGAPYTKGSPAANQFYRSDVVSHLRQEFLIPEAGLRSGLNFDIDATRIIDFDSEDQRQEYIKMLQEKYM